MVRSFAIVLLLTGCTAACFGEVPMEGSSEESSSSSSGDPESSSSSLSSSSSSSSSTNPDPTVDEDDSSSSDGSSSESSDGSSTGADEPDYALRFDGDSYAQAEPTTWDQTDFTVEAWIRVTGEDASGIIVDQQDLDTFCGWSFYLTPGNGNLTFSFFDGTNSNHFIQGPSLDPGWHHVAGIKDADQIALYLDGVQSASATVPEEVASASISMTIGANLHASAEEFALHGVVVDDVRVSSEALYDEDFDPGAYDAQASTLVFLGFDEGSGSTTEDPEGMTFTINDPAWVDGYRPG